MRIRFAGATALLVLASGAVTAPASAAASPARGVLGAETTITWSGDTAIRLAVARPTQYRDGAVDLVVSGATYAFVRLMAPYRAGCPDHVGPRCATSRVSWVKGVHDQPMFAGRPPTRRHQSLLPVPPKIDAPYLDVFLFTDGRATLTIRTTGLRGRTAYRPRAALHGQVALLPATCVPLGCATATGRTNGATYGGAAFDLRGPGWAEIWAVNGGDPDGQTTNQLHTLATCFYPNFQRRAASPDPARHPFGCDDTGDASAAADSMSRAAFAHATSAWPGVAHGYNAAWSGAVGRQYVGFQAIGAGPAPSRARAYGIWFRFLD